MERGVIIRGIALGVAAMFAVAGAVALWVLLYAFGIAPGHDGAHYQAYGQRVAPLAAIIAGLPVLLAAGWLAARGKQPMLASLIPAATYMALDVALSAAGNSWPPLWALILSWLSKAAVAGAGGWLAERRRERAKP